MIACSVDENVEANAVRGRMPEKLWERCLGKDGASTLADEEVYLLLVSRAAIVLVKSATAGVDVVLSESSRLMLIASSFDS